jgi:hypothetical protein
MLGWLLGFSVYALFGFGAGFGAPLAGFSPWAGQTRSSLALLVYAPHYPVPNHPVLLGGLEAASLLGVGVVTAGAQWIAIRSRSPVSWAWIPVTAASVVGSELLYLQALRAAEVPKLLLLAAVAGGLVGSVQYFFLGRYLASARRWILAAILAWMLGIIASALLPFPSESSPQLLGLDSEQMRQQAQEFLGELTTYFQAAAFARWLVIALVAGLTLDGSMADAHHADGGSE